MTRHNLFDVSQLELLSVDVRGNRLSRDRCSSPLHHPCASRFSAPSLVDAVLASRSHDKPVLLFMGGHLIKLGLAPFLIDLIDQGLITHVASNGSAVIHDYELARIGGTSEDVGKWIAAGQFGLWRETSELNDIIRDGARLGEGLGETVGRHIVDAGFPHEDVSICAACHRNQIPYTCHVSIGSDIIHMMPNFNSSALGETSYTDFLIFAHAIQQIENGVFLNVGSAVAGPEVFLKALSMARNVAHQRGQHIRNFTTGVFDLVGLPDNYASGPPDATHPLYYFRPWKTLLCRTVAGDGASHYLQGDFQDTIPAFWHSLTKSLANNTEV